jgi:hypothetical protein
LLVDRDAEQRELRALAARGRPAMALLYYVSASGFSKAFRSAVAAAPQRAVLRSLEELYAPA